MAEKIIKNEDDFLEYCNKHEIDPILIKDSFLNCTLSDETENVILCVSWGHRNEAHYSIVVPKGYHHVIKMWLLCKDALHKEYNDLRYNC